MPFANVELPSRVYRISENPQVFTYRASRSDPVHRWDDPFGIYGVLYTSETAFGALIETLGDFRTDLETLAEVDNIEVNDAPSPDTIGLNRDTVATGTVQARYLDKLHLGEAILLDGVAADVTHLRSLTHIRSILARYLVARNHPDLGADLILARDRSLTQAVSRAVYESTAEFSAIRCPSYYGLDVVNWSLFSGPLASLRTRVQVAGHSVRSLSATDPDVVAACEALNIKVV